MKGAPRSFSLWAAVAATGTAVLLAACPAPAALPACGTGAVSVAGERKRWHDVSLSFNGPALTEAGTPNPFLDYRLQVSFTAPSGRMISVPGYFAADGNAAETSASGGAVWRAHLMPDEVGIWSFRAAFRTGTNVAVSLDPAAGTANCFDGASGTFAVVETDKVAPDMRDAGLLRYAGSRYLQFAGTGARYLKGGANSPENLLAYADFDQTTPSHRYAPHAGDFRTGDPTWQGTKGRNLDGALDYLSSKGMNDVYFLTMNVGGDGKDVWPWTSSAERYRFDASKLDQWDIAFSQMTRLGIVMHVITQETENDQLLDGGALGVQRMLYYRELIARFAQHPGILWNLGEENSNTDAQRKQFADYIRALDPYDHPIVVHTFPDQKDAVYGPLLGFQNFEGVSLQESDVSGTHAETLKWVDRSAAAGRAWIVSLDEEGPSTAGVVPDVNDPSHDLMRKQALWANLMAGGDGTEWYFGYSYPNNDLTCEDWRSRDRMWDETRYALNFFQRYLPFSRMRSSDGLTPVNDYVLAAPGHTYAVYLPNGGTTTLNLGRSLAAYTVRWYDPRAGGGLHLGSVRFVLGPGRAFLGSPPSNPKLDWVVLVRKL